MVVQKFLVGGGAETEKDYHSPLRLLILWIKSEKIVNIIGQSVSQFWLDWIESTFLPQTQYLAFYIRFDIRCFDRCSNSVNEGYNYMV